MSTTHTPGELKYVPIGDGDGEVFGIDHFVMDAADNQLACLNNEADARRLAAAWNACAGIPTAGLEAGAVAGLLSALVDLLGLYETPRDAVGGVERMVLARVRSAIAKAADPLPPEQLRERRDGAE